MERVPQSVIDELLSESDLKEIVSEHIALKPLHSGLYQGVCPFHRCSERTLRINHDDQTFECIECDFSGSAIGWLMYHDGLPFQSALYRLAADTGVDIEPWVSVVDIQASESKQAALLSEVAAFYHAALLESDVALDYIRLRGLTMETVERFGIGSAAADFNGRDLLKTFPGRTRDLWHAGVLVRLADKTFSPRFRDRIIFPIRSGQGEIVGFGGRALGNSTPKYVNSASSSRFNKGELLYGLADALVHDRHPKYLIVVEGYMDVLTFSQHGFRSVVGTLGTAITEQHLANCFKFTDEVVLCLDGDAAGIDASNQAMEVAARVINDTQRVSVVLLPDEHDPDSYLREKGSDCMTCLINERMDFIDFIIRQLSAGVDFSEIGQCARFASEAKRFIDVLKSEHYQRELTEKVEKLVGVSFG